MSKTGVLSDSQAQHTDRQARYVALSPSNSTTPVQVLVGWVDRSFYSARGQVVYCVVFQHGTANIAPWGKREIDARPQEIAAEDNTRGERGITWREGGDNV